MQRTRPTEIIAVSIACVLTAGITAAGAGGRGARPAARPRTAVGHPGNPVVVGSEAFAFTARAGSVVHVRLTRPLDIPLTGQSRRYSFTSSGAWGAFTLAAYPMTSAGGVVKGWQAATVRSATVCTDRSVPCPADGRIDAFSDTDDRTLASGDYVLAVAGPPGSTVSFTLRSFDELAPVVDVDHFYALPFRTSTVTKVPAAAHDDVLPTQHEYGNWLVPTTGRHMLAGVLLGVGTKTQDNLQYSLCPGGSTGAPTTQGAWDSTGSSCRAGEGYGLYLGNMSAAHPLNQGGAYVALVVGTGQSTWEGRTGGAYTLSCDGGDCTSYAVAYVIALDS